MRATDLPDDQRQEIYQRYKNGETIAELARAYGLSYGFMRRLAPRPPGEQYDGRAKITVEQVKEIKTRLTNGDKQIDIARDLGIQPGIVQLIYQGETWKYVKVKGFVPNRPWNR